MNSSTMMKRMETRKNVLTRMVFMLMVATVIVLAVPMTVSAATITVPDDYPSIQQAIDIASAGDTVYVRSGTYHERVTIGKSLTLEGEDKDGTIIDAGGTGKAIYVSANNVTIKGVTATNGENGIDLVQNYSIHHIVISNCIATLNTRGITGGHVGEYITIENCEVSNNERNGIYSHQFDNSIVRNCTVFENGTWGIDIAWCSNSSIVNCDVYSNKSGYAIVLDSTSHCIVEGCNVWKNNGPGIVVYRAGRGHNNTVRNNVVANNSLGIGLYGQGAPYDNQIYHNNIISNAVQASDTSNNNRWDNGYPSGGNYWSDYGTEDLYSGAGQDVPGSDGIGDTPYVIDGDSKDNFPWVSRDGWTDGDGDGIPNGQDAFPNDPAEWGDNDRDGTGDNADQDDDNDSLSDTAEAAAGTDPFNPDSDGDGTNDGEDSFPSDPSESADSDGDGTGDNADTDDDNDGVADASDAFPKDPTETADTDGDGTGDNADTDDDNDGVADESDAFPKDPTETVDTDGDGTGDNADTDDDNDGAADESDAFPKDPTETVDTDGDGTGDNADTDDDNDGQSDADETACGSDPLDPDSMSPDNDGDKSPDCVDTDDDNDGTLDVDDAFPLDSTEDTDTDGDGVGDNADAFPDSETSPAVVVGGCDSGVSNVLNWDGNGSSINDEFVILDAGDYRNHAAYVRTVSHFAETLLDGGVITKEGMDAIVLCAKKSDVGKKDKKK